MAKKNNPDETEVTYSIEEIIENIVEEKMGKLVKNDIKALARELMPHLDQIIANKIKEHFYQIGNFLAEKFKESGE